MKDQIIRIKPDNVHKEMLIRILKGEECLEEFAQLPGWSRNKNAASARAFALMNFTIEQLKNPELKMAIPVGKKETTVEAVARTKDKIDKLGMF